jgi:group II intron reverse transcriptase/maturase
VYIPKADGTKRGLGIPTVEDKIVQMGIKKILEAVFEGDFCEVSYGFRPKRNAHQALNALDKAIMSKPVNIVVDMDISKYFDTINHGWLMKCLKQRIADTSLLRLIGRFLNTGIMEEGKYIEVEQGTPQGGIISPTLSNIYLHYVLDLWFEKKVKKELKGYAQLIRYADDFVAVFQSKREANDFAAKLTQRLDKFGLKIAQNKSRVIEFGRYVWQRAQAAKEGVATFNFLGFTHYCDKARNGGFKLGRKTSKVKFAQKAKAMNRWLKGIRNLMKLQDWWKTLKRKLTGHYNYYGISGNIKALVNYYDLVAKLAFKWINRRSQKKSFTWEQFNRFLSVNPLPVPRIQHSIYLSVSA